MQSPVGSGHAEQWWRKEEGWRPERQVASGLETMVLKQQLALCYCCYCLEIHDGKLEFLHNKIHRFSCQVQRVLTNAYLHN